MCGCHWFVTSRHQQSQPLGIIAARLYLYGAAFHGAGLCAFGAAAYRIIKIGQAEKTLVIGAGKPFRRDAANTLAARHVNAESHSKQAAHSGSGSSWSWIILLMGWVKAQRCAATLPVGETGGARCKGGRGRRGITRPAQAPDEGPGRGRLGRPSRTSVSDPLRRAGGSAPSRTIPARAPAEAGQRNLIRMCKPKNLTSDHPDRRIPDRRRRHEHDEAPLVSGAPWFAGLNRRCGGTR